MNRRQPGALPRLRANPEIGCTFSVRVSPRSKRDDLTMMADGVWKISVTAPPEEGRANQAVVELLADRLGVKRHQISIVRGLGARQKVVRVTGVEAAALERRLFPTAEGSRPATGAGD